RVIAPPDPEGPQLPHQPPAHAPVCLHPLRVQSLFPPLEGLEPEAALPRFVREQIHPAAREADGVLPLAGQVLQPGLHRRHVVDADGAALPIGALPMSVFSAHSLLPLS
ncbi:ArsR family transcriptional regulator, partial [Dysosmobacter welbionis]